MIKIGKFTIRRHDDRSIWIECEDGEGGQFSDDFFEAALQEFYSNFF